MPIVVGNELLGVLDLQSNTSDCYSYDDELNVRTVAATIAATIGRLNETEGWKLRSSAWEHLHNVLESDNLSDMASKVSEGIFTLFPAANTCQIWEYDNQWRQLRLSGFGTRSYARNISNNQECYYIPVDKSVAGRVVTSGNPVRLYDLENQENFYWKDFVKSTGATGLLAAPIPAVGQQPFGCMIIYTESDYHFSDNDEALFQSACRFIGVAITTACVRLL